MQDAPIRRAPKKWTTLLAASLRWLRCQRERAALLWRAVHPSDKEAREIISASLRRRVLKNLFIDDDEARRSHEISTILYQEWIRRFDTLRLDDEKAILDHIDGADLPRPLALFLFDKNSARFALATIKHLREQILSDFDAVFVFGEECSARTIASAKAAIQDDTRFTISSASHNQLQGCLTQRRDVLLAEGGVLLRKHALYMFLTAKRDCAPCVVYADEDHLDAWGVRRRPRFKPGFSPELLRRDGYTGPCIFLHSIELDAGLILNEQLPINRLTASLIEEATDTAVVHVPFVLYHDARSRSSSCHQPDLRLTQEMRPSVSIIIPTKNRLEFLEPCLASIEAHTLYPRTKFEIVVIDNGSADPAALRYLQESAGRGAIRLLSDDTPFNYSRLNNLAVQQSTGEVLVFLNNDTVINHPLWLEFLVAQAIKDDVGAVGAKLLYPDRTVQFGGTIVGLQGVAGHAHVGLAADDGGYSGLANLTREIGAATGACLAIRRKVYDEVGGLDLNLAVSCNDVLFCCDLIARGFRNIFIAQPLLFHCESKSRGGDDTEDKIERAIWEGRYTRTRHKRLFQNDPYYSPNLSYERAYDIAFPPRRAKPWRQQGLRRRKLRVLFLGNLDQMTEGEVNAFNLQLDYIAELGLEVLVGGQHVRSGSRRAGCAFIRLHHPMEAAAYAVANDVDCIVVHSVPFFSVVRWIGNWPSCILCDHGEPNDLPAPAEESRHRQELERQFCLGIADRVFVMCDRECAKGKEPFQPRSPADLAELVEATCRP